MLQRQQGKQSPRGGIKATSIAAVVVPEPMAGGSVVRIGPAVQRFKKSATDENATLNLNDDVIALFVGKAKHIVQSLKNVELE
eukprot:12429853-Karenia_brevis.AAC.1